MGQPHTGPRRTIHRNTANTTTYNSNFPTPHSRQVTTPATRCVHPSRWLPPPTTPTFRTNKPKGHHKTNTFCPITLVSYNPEPSGPTHMEDTAGSTSSPHQNPREQQRQRRSPGIPKESRGSERRRRDLNPRGAMHPYLLSREAHSTGLCDVSSADYSRLFSPRARTAPAASAQEAVGSAEGEGFEPPVPLLTQRFSRPSLSATQTALQTCSILQEQAHTREADGTGTGTARPAVAGETGSSAHHI